MEYRIHHLNLVEPAGQQSFFEKEIQTNIPRIQKIFLNYPGKPVLHFFIKKEDTEHYRIFASLHLNGNDILVKEEGNRSMSLVNNTLDKLRNQVKKQLQMERKVYLLNRKNRIIKMADSFLPQMIEHLEQKDETAFVNLAKEVLPEVETYIFKALSRKPALARLVSNKLIPAQEIIDDIYNYLYAGMQKRNPSFEHIIPLVLSLTETKLTKQEKEYMVKFKEPVSSKILSKKEIKDIYDLTKKISDPHIKPVLEEELDEKYFVPGEYDLSEILSDAGADEAMIMKAEYTFMYAELLDLAGDMTAEQQSVFEMYYLDRFTSEEIAYICHLSESHIEKLLDDIRHFFLLNVKQS